MAFIQHNCHLFIKPMHMEVKWGTITGKLQNDNIEFKVCVKNIFFKII